LLIEALAPIINHWEDQVMFIDLGPADGRGTQTIETLGRAISTAASERVAFIV